MLIIFFDYKDVLHHEYALRGQAINKEFYPEVLKRLYVHSEKKTATFL